MKQKLNSQAHRQSRMSRRPNSRSRAKSELNPNFNFKIDLEKIHYFMEKTWWTPEHHFVLQYDFSLFCLMVPYVAI